MVNHCFSLWKFALEKSNLDVTDSYWYSGESDNPVGDGNCVLLGRMMYDAYLYDTGCGSDRNFICEKPKKQTTLIQ